MRALRTSVHGHAASWSRHLASGSSWPTIPWNLVVDHGRTPSEENEHLAHRRSDTLVSSSGDLLVLIESPLGDNVGIVIDSIATGLVERAEEQRPSLVP